MTDRIVRAMVTGASAGIGAAFARRLAAHGVELVLVARRESRLRALADELPVATEVVVADLGDHAALDRVAARAATSLDPVDLVINNAGSGWYGGLAGSDTQRLEAMLAVNVVALTRLTRCALPQLVERGTGGIINVGSTAGYRPCPHAAVYGASKAYVRSFTEAVHEELRGTGVHVMLVAPGSTATEFQQLAGLRGGARAATVRSSPDEVATEALRAYASRRAVCVPGSGSRIAALGAQLLPTRVTRRLSAVATRRMMPG